MFSFPKKFRLHRAKEFQSVIQFKRSVSCQLLQLYLKPNKGGFPRLGLVVARKVAQNAVKRNKFKRVLKEVFRLHRHKLGNNDYIFRLRNLPTGTKIAPADIVKEANTLIFKARQCDNY
ncbi:MAG: ribonuclease P protein component [Nitrosomonas sp.]|nr:ribonuclease P protein component [Nitrosomonas sp.]MBK7365978.1 ribonuclease P protein component [Nitrosomonas sp.]